MALKEKNRRRQICHFLIDFSYFLKNLGNGWSKSIVLENKVVLNFDFRHGAKNQVNRATHLGAMAISQFSSERAK